MEGNVFDPDNAMDIPSSTKARPPTPKKKDMTTDFGGYDDGQGDGWGLDDQKHCDACTLLNPLDAIICEICRTPFN
jgi:hypothetical protein